jgi:type III pantothenate kinase
MWKRYVDAFGGEDATISTEAHDLPRRRVRLTRSRTYGSAAQLAGLAGYCASVAGCEGGVGATPTILDMLLAVDVGNTQTVLGLYADGVLTESWRTATDATRTGDELGVLLAGMLDLDAVDGICLSSTVPALVREWERLAERWSGAPILVVGPGVKTGIPIRYDDPREVGPDRIVNAVAAKHRYGAPVIVVDFGTSTNFDVVSPAGEYVGGVLAPGIETSMEALFARAARLVKIDYVEPPSVIGKTTVGGLQSGVVYGFAGQVDGIVAAIRGELGVDARVIATGGLAALVAPHSSTIESVDPFLTLDGLWLVWGLNT